jgi:hypothetical protein
MLTEAEPKTKKPRAALRDLRSKALDAVSALVDLNQRAVGGLIELSSAAAAESVQAYTELQAAAIEAVRPATEATEAIEEPREGPGTRGWEALGGWYRRGVDRAVDDAQRALKLLEKNGQIIARSTERQQSSAERVGKEIREALEVYSERMREIYRRN